MGSNNNLKNLAGVDLNLLTAFDALMREGQVSRAAKQVGRSQSAMSHTLGRLRELFGDELFVRDIRGLIPTPKAVELNELIGPALASVRMAMAGQGRFDPGSSQRHFVVAMPDVASFALMPGLMPRLRRTAPQVNLSVVDFAMGEGIDAIMSGEVELALGYFPELPEQIQSRQVGTLDAVGIADRKNRWLRGGGMTLKAFLSAPHVLSTFSSNAFGTDVDRYLSTHGVHRRFALRLPHYLSLPSAIKGTDLVAAIERGILPRLPDRQGLVEFELPFEKPSTGVLVIWHQRHQKDPGHQWLRELLCRAMQGT